MYMGLEAEMAEDKAKYRKIFEYLRKEIRDGRYPRGVPLPSEESLVRKYKVSRITAVRAMDELVKCGLVYRKRLARGGGTCPEPVNFQRNFCWVL